MPSVRASWARWPPDSLRAFCLGSSPSSSIRRRARASSQPGLRWLPSCRWSAMRQPAVGGRVLGDEADLGQLRRALGGAAAEHLDRARGRLQHADGEVQQRALAGAVGADEPDDAAGRDVQRAVRQRVAAAVALAQSLGQDRGAHATCRLAEERKVAMNSASMLSSSSPDRRALFIQRCRSWRSGPCAAKRRVRQRLRDERPEPGTGGDEPVVLELAVGLQDRVGVDREDRDHVLDRRELVALAQQAQPQRVPDLPHQLLVGREAGARVQVELNHSPIVLAQ